jgi:CheY-like chemotaxis protein
MAEKSHLESSLLNLVINARDALPEGGRIVVVTANQTVDHAVDDGNFRADAGDYAMLSVSDNGIGMPGTVLARIFEPFFTTKEPGHGTGLGLSMIYSFVQECGGFMTVDSAPGRGTTIRLYLKRWEAVPDAAGDPAAPHPRAQDGETVLVVEDDVEVLRATADSLRELGYDVVEAANGAAALDLLAGGRRVDVLFTDIAMPGGMNGWQLAKAAAERHPALGILYTSGYADRALGGGRDASAELLHKPYRDYELAEAIRRVLDGAPARSTGEARLT